MLSQLLPFQQQTNLSFAGDDTYHPIPALPNHPSNLRCLLRHTTYLNPDGLTSTAALSAGDLQRHKTGRNDVGFHKCCHRAHKGLVLLSSFETPSLLDNRSLSSQWCSRTQIATCPSRSVSYGRRTSIERSIPLATGSPLPMSLVLEVSLTTLPRSQPAALMRWHQNRLLCNTTLFCESARICEVQAWWTQTHRCISLAYSKRERARIDRTTRSELSTQIQRRRDTSRYAHIVIISRKTHQDTHTS